MSKSEDELFEEWISIPRFDKLDTPIREVCRRSFLAGRASLTGDLAAVTKQRDVLFKACVAEINRPIILKAIEDIQVMYLNEDEIKYYADLEAIAAIETGGQNGKE